MLENQSGNPAGLSGKPLTLSGDPAALSDNPETGLMEEGKRNRLGAVLSRDPRDLVSGLGERSTPGKNR